MLITLTPVRRNEPLNVERRGDTLILNGEVFDFGPLPEGAILPSQAIDSDWFAGPVTRESGELSLTLVLPHGPAAPQETLFPVPITVTSDGPVTLPEYGHAEEPADMETPE